MRLAEPRRLAIVNGAARPLIVGVAGGSGSGKSTVAHALARALGPESATVIDMDGYYRDHDHLTADELRAVNWDHPESLDLDLLAEHLEQLAAGQSVRKPCYDFSIHRRRPHSEVVEPRRIIIVEGILLFVDSRVRAACDMKVYVEAEADLRLIRRIQRDMRDRGRPLAEILDQYLTTVRPMHLAFVEPSKRHADVIMPEGGHNEPAMHMLVADIERHLELRVTA